MLFIHAHMAIINDYVLVMDELNVKLHPLLLKFFIDLFYDNNSMAQLIYTTHDTTLRLKNLPKGPDLVCTERRAGTFGIMCAFGL